MEPIAVDVVLHGGYDHSFSRGRSWRVVSGPSTGAEPGSLEILDDQSRVVALIAAERWGCVGYRYAQPVSAKAAVTAPTLRSLGADARRYLRARRGVGA